MIRRLRIALRLVAALFTIGSIALMFWPDAFQAVILGMGLGGQFVLGTVIVAALALEVFFRGSTAGEPAAEGSSVTPADGDVPRRERFKPR